LNKRGKEHRKVEEYRAKCVHPAWLNACQQFGQRVPEKLYDSTYNPNRSLTFISAGDDEDEENLAPPPTTTKIVKRLPIISKPKKVEILSPKVLVPQKLSQISNEAESMLNDLESSLAQFLNQNSTSSSSISRSMTNDDEHNRKSLHMIRSINHHNNANGDEDIEPSMRVEWLDDAMQAERQKIRDEDEHGSQQSTNSPSGQKRTRSDSNFDNQYFQSKKKCRI